MTIESREQDHGSSRASRKSRGSPAIIEAGGSGADETAWLIEETWSGFVHYVHRDFRCDKVAREWRQNDWRRSYGAPARHTQKIVTKDIDEAMRFPTRGAAELWLTLQPHWMGGDQYQVREHMWPAPSSEAQPPACERSEQAAPATDEQP